MVNLAPGLLGSLDTNQKVQGSLPLCAAEGMACPRGTSNPCLSPAHYYYKGFLYIKSKLNYHINGFPLAHSPPPNSPLQLQGGLPGLTNNLDFRNVDTLELGPMLQILLAGSKEKNSATAI